VTESVLLTAGAGLPGMVFAAWGVDLIHSMVPPVTARYITGWDHVGIDLEFLAGVLHGGRENAAGERSKSFSAWKKKMGARELRTARVIKAWTSGASAQL
jgi:hypothetical protein